MHKYIGSQDMDGHTQAVVLDHLIQTFMKIKALSASASIDTMCVDGMCKCYALSDALHLKHDLEIVRQRRIDPTN